MTWKVPLFDLRLGAEEEDAVLGVVRSGWLSMGPKTDEFERAFAEKLGCAHAIAVSSGTAALHLTLRALWVGAGDEVIVPDLTFVATANAVLQQGATPVLADVVGAHDLTVDPRDIERKITDNTRAIIVVHYGGFACDMDAITALGEEFGLAVVEDAAHAPGATYGEQRLGTIGHAGCFSFHSNKNIAAGEGGMVTTDDDDHADRIRAMRSHAMTAPDLARRTGDAWGYDLKELGFNYRPTDIESALGLVQLARLDENNAARATLAQRYRERLAGVAGVGVPFGDEWVESRPEGTLSAHHLMEVLLPEGVERAAVQHALAEAGVQTSVHYRPLHTFSSPLLAAAPANGLEQIGALADRLLSLPLWPGMAESDVDLVVDALSAVL